MGVCFTPDDDDEGRLVLAYLSGLEGQVGLSWFSHTRPEDRSLKVAIRGLPLDTTPQDVTEALAEKGFVVDYAKQIWARAGRPGSLYYAALRRTPDLIPAIYSVSDLLSMSGITVEAWRGRKNAPAQCHRC